VDAHWVNDSRRGFRWANIREHLLQRLKWAFRGRYSCYQRTYMHRHRAPVGHRRDEANRSVSDRGESDRNSGLCCLYPYHKCRVLYLWYKFRYEGRSNPKHRRQRVSANCNHHVGLRQFQRRCFDTSHQFYDNQSNSNFCKLSRWNFQCCSHKFWSSSDEIQLRAFPGQTHHHISNGQYSTRAEYDVFGLWNRIYTRS
jgi:hypothetical protein